MDSILVLQNRHWKNEKYSGLIERKLLQAILHRSTLKEIQVLMGMRRSGKSSILRLLINELMIQSDPRCILYANLDDPFVKKDNVFVAIQATIALGDHNLHRELEGLRSAMSVHELKSGYIITVDKEEIIDDSVSVVPLWNIDML